MSRRATTLLCFDRFKFCVINLLLFCHRVLIKLCQKMICQNESEQNIDDNKLSEEGVCKSRNPTRNLPGTPGTPPGTPGTPPGTPETPPGTPGTPPGTPGTPPGTPPGTSGTPPGTRWNTSYEATHVFLYKFTCFALNSSEVMDGYDLYFLLVLLFF